jgi:hypothetical protein
MNPINSINPINPMDSKKSTKMDVRETLFQWIDRGVVIMPIRPLRREALYRYKASGKTVAEMVIEDRR